MGYTAPRHEVYGEWFVDGFESDNASEEPHGSTKAEDRRLIESRGLSCHQKLRIYCVQVIDETRN
jgi:hypothetical protein